MGAQPQLYMDAVITPNRSLSKRGLYVILGLLAAYNLLLGVFLLAIGAFPVPIFLGLDFIAVWLAFRISNRRAKRAERVRVSSESVEVERSDPAGQPIVVWRSPTAFTRVAVEDAGEHHVRVEVRLSGRVMAVAASLSPLEREAFADALERAILAARRYASALPISGEA